MVPIKNYARVNRMLVLDPTILLDGKLCRREVITLPDK